MSRGGAIRAVGFDLDDTLFDHRGAAVVGVRRFLGQRGIDATDAVLAAWFRAEDEQYERWRSGEIGFPEQRRERLRTVLPQLGLAVPASDSGLDALFDDYLAAYRDAWRVFPDVVPLLRTLRQRGYRIGLLTNGSEAQQRDKLARTGLADAFDAVCVSERIGVQKPDPRAFTILAERLGVEAGACLFVGDDPERDVAGARRAGMCAVLVDRSADAAPALDELVDAALTAPAHGD
ncbi:HAD family hydrolase [Curtobacterium sp. DN_7.5]|uniref:HAD family hydrolase n=1 Tax=Curtobacterium sp. DN_7.5 TaxID=3049047 RepID=UPI001F59562F|nr:HAD family hydrolase [Curtobacterium sp. DN_7.5]